MKVGIIGAMEPEIAILRERMSDVETHQHGGFTFYHGQLNTQTVTLVQSGIGKVAATVATTLLIDHFHPDCVINTGSAGGFDQRLEVGDVAIASELRHHDVDVTAFGYEYGQVPQMPAAYESHPQLIQVAEQSISQLQQCQSLVGLVCTGDSFMCDPERIDATRKQFPAMLAVEMEGAAIAQACHLLDTAFVVIRSLSDIAGKESPHSFEEYLEVASKNSSAMVMAMLTKLNGVTL